MWRLLTTPIFSKPTGRRLRRYLLVFILVHAMLGLASTQIYVEINPTDTTQWVFGDGVVAAGYRTEQIASSRVVVARSGQAFGSLHRDGLVWWPLLSLAVFFCGIVLPAMLAGRLLTRPFTHTAKADACISCDYDLTGLPPARPCPECGARRC